MFEPRTPRTTGSFVGPAARMLHLAQSVLHMLPPEALRSRLAHGQVATQGGPALQRKAQAESGAAFGSQSWPDDKILNLFLFIFWPHLAARGILVPQPGIRTCDPCNRSVFFSATGLPGKCLHDRILNRSFSLHITGRPGGLKTSSCAKEPCSPQGPWRAPL